MYRTYMYTVTGVYQVSCIIIVEVYMYFWVYGLHVHVD